MATTTLLGAVPTRAADAVTIVEDRCPAAPGEASVAPVAIPTALLDTGEMVPLRDRTGEKTFDLHAPDSAMATPVCTVQRANGRLTYHWLYCNNPAKNTCANGTLRQVVKDRPFDAGRVAYALSLVDNRTASSRALSQRLVWCATENVPARGPAPGYFNNTTPDPFLPCPDWNNLTPSVELVPPTTRLGLGDIGRVTIRANRRSVTIDSGGALAEVCRESTEVATLTGDRLTFASPTGGTAVLCLTNRTGRALTATVTAATTSDTVVTWQRRNPGDGCQGLMELSAIPASPTSADIEWGEVVALRTSVAAPAFRLDGRGVITIDVTNDGPDVARQVTVRLQVPGVTLAADGDAASASATLAPIPAIAPGRRATVVIGANASSAGTFTGEVRVEVPPTMTDLGPRVAPVVVSVYTVTGSVTREPEVSETSTGPPTSGPPTTRPPSSRPPSSGPPTSGPPTSGPPTSGPPTSGPPTSGPPTSGPPTSRSTPTTPPSTIPNGPTPGTSTPGTSTPRPTALDPTSSAATTSTTAIAGLPDPARRRRDPTPILDDEPPIERDGAYHYAYVAWLVKLTAQPTVEIKAVLHLPDGVTAGEMPDRCEPAALTNDITCRPNPAEVARLDRGEAISWRILVTAEKNRPVDATLTSFERDQRVAVDAEATTFPDFPGPQVLPRKPASNPHLGALSVALAAATAAVLIAGGVWLQSRRQPTGPGAALGALDAR